MFVSVVIPVLNEAPNLKILIPWLKRELKSLVEDFEIIIVDGGSDDNSFQIAKKLGCKVFVQKESGFTSALKEGFRVSQGDYILTLDADLSHSPSFLARFIKYMQDYDIIIGSRYVKGGRNFASFLRKISSILLNCTFRLFLRLPIRDVTSGYRIYRKEVLESISLEGENFEILPFIIIEALKKGFKIKEVPIIFLERRKGRSKASLIKFGYSFLKVLIKNL